MDFLLGVTLSIPFRIPEITKIMAEEGLEFIAFQFLSGFQFAVERDFATIFAGFQFLSGFQPYEAIAKLAEEITTFNSFPDSSESQETKTTG